MLCIQVSQVLAERVGLPQERDGGGNIEKEG
jgi:hypothetical protein